MTCTNLQLHAPSVHLDADVAVHGDVILKQQGKVVVAQAGQPCDGAEHFLEGGQQRELALRAHIRHVRVRVVVVHLRTQQPELAQNAQQALWRSWRPWSAVFALAVLEEQAWSGARTLNSRSASFSDGLTGTTRCAWMPKLARTSLVLSQRSSTPLITYASTAGVCRMRIASVSPRSVGRLTALLLQPRLVNLACLQARFTLMQRALASSSAKSASTDLARRRIGVMLLVPRFLWLS